MFAAWRAGDVATAVAQFAPDGIYREARAEPLHGRAAIGAHWERFFTGGPPWRLAPGAIFGDGTRFAIPYVFSMQTKDGSWQDRPGCALVTVRDDLITEWREYSG